MSALPSRTRTTEGGEAMWNAMRVLLQAQRHGPPLERVSRDAPLPASFAQVGGWILEQLQPATFLYNLTVGWRMRGDLNVQCLEWSFAEMVRRHEVLRTTLRFVDGRLLQIILPAPEFVMPVIDLSTCEADRRREEAQRQALEEACVPFDIERAPVMRARLFKLEAAEYLLVTTVHHLAFDGWSLDPFMRELCAIYDAGIAAKSSPLSQPALQYADWSVWQRRRMETEYVSPLLDYWREQLRNTVAPKCLSFDRSRMRGTAPQIGRHAFAVSKELTEEIRHLAAGSGVTAFVLMLAAFQTLLYRRNGQEDIVVGSPIANRNRMELTEMIGCFVNLLALRVHIGDRPTFRSLVERVHRVVLEAYQHQDLPIELLVQSLSWERESEPRALYQAAFVFQNLPKSEWQFPGLIVEGYEILNGMAHRDLTLFIKETNSGFSGSFEYDAAVFDAATISELARQYGALLEGVVGDPTQRVDRISLSSPQEQRVLEQFRSVLGNPQIGPHDSFFNAGGDSLLALKLLARLENLSGNDIPPATLFEHPTAAAFAVVLHNVVRGPLTTTDLGAHIVEIRRGLSKFPLFLIPGGSGGKAEMMLYSRMFSHFVSDQRVYGLREDRKIEVEKGRRSIEQRAAGCIAEIRRLQPRGPYSLVGECVGGVVAFEMAKQLAEAGEEVEPLVLFDAWIPREIESLKRQRFGSIRSMKSVVQSVFRIGLANLRRELQRNDSTNKAGAMKRKVFSLVRNFTYVAGSAGRAANAIDAVMRYQPKPYRGRVIFVASEQLNKDGVPELWRQLAEGGLAIHILSGNHESYIRNSPEAAARLLERTLDEFQQVAR